MSHLASLKIVLACLLLAGCMGPEEASREAQRAVEDSGFTSVVITGPGFLICNQDSDAYRYNWKGKNVQGKEVTGQACRGMWFKGWTVRIN